MATGRLVGVLLPPRRGCQPHKTAPASARVANAEGDGTNCAARRSGRAVVLRLVALFVGDDAVGARDRVLRLAREDRRRRRRPPPRRRRRRRRRRRIGAAVSNGAQRRRAVPAPLTSAHADGGWPAAARCAAASCTLAAGFSSISTLRLHADDACASSRLSTARRATPRRRGVLARLDAPTVLFDGGANATAAYDDRGAFGGACDDGRATRTASAAARRAARRTGSGPCRRATWRRRRARCASPSAVAPRARVRARRGGGRPAPPRRRRRRRPRCSSRRRHGPPGCSRMRRRRRGARRR